MLNVPSSSIPGEPKAPATLSEVHGPMGGQQMPDIGRQGVQGLWFFECVHPTQPQRRADGVALRCVPARCALLLEVMGAARGLSLLHAVALAAGQGERDLEKFRRQG